MIRKILVPLDGSAHAEHVLPLAAASAARTGATLVLATVHTAPVPNVGIDDMAAAWAALDRQSRIDERDYLTQQAAFVSSAYAITPRTVLLDGDPASELVRYATAEAIDLIAMTTHGRGGATRLWLGSVADRVVRRAEQPVLLWRPDTPVERTDLSFERVLVPLDGTRRAERAITTAWELLDAGGVLHLLNVVQLPFMFAPPPRFGGGPESQNVQKRKLIAYRYLRRLALAPRDDGRAVAVRVVESLDPAREILRYCTDERIDLVAIATHGRGGVARWAYGSVEDKIVRAGRCPVLVCRVTEPGEGMSDRYREAMRERDPVEQAV